MPASAGLIRPSAVTAVASCTTSPAPPRANDPRCTRCQSVGCPSTDVYWHIGEIQARLRNVVPRSRNGEKSRLTYGAKTRTGGRDSRRGSVHLGDGVVRLDLLRHVRADAGRGQQLLVAAA